MELLVTAGADVHGISIESDKEHPSTRLQNVLVGFSGQSRYMSDMESTEIQIAKYLIQSGAKVNMFRGETFPPLHLAVMRNSPEMVEYLLQAGADTNCSHTSGLTALGMACLTEHGSKISFFNLNKFSGLRISWFLACFMSWN